MEVYMCVQENMYVETYVCVQEYMHIHVEAKGQCHITSYFGGGIFFI